jgi:ectoine hydroxylase-related dioxygenase (phytanoyl-CoA dioxygenase family)
MLVSDSEIRRVIELEGALVVENVLSPSLVSQLRMALVDAIEKEAEYHGTQSYSDYGMVLLCALYGEVLREICGHSGLMQPFEAVMGEGCVIYAYTSSSMPPADKNYSSRIHVDCPRLIPGYITNMGATIALSDFTEENGATYYLPGSSDRVLAPSEEEFYANAKRFVAPAGSVLYFNARTWHAGGVNATDAWRHALTINMGRVWMKQRIDIPRALSHIDTKSLSSKALQKLGFLSQVPSSYDEYYAPVEKRTFKQRYE